MAKIKRRNYLIDKALQGKYIAMILVVLLVHTVIVLAAVFSPYIMMLTLEFPLGKKAEAAKAFLLVHANAWPVIGGFILFIAFLTIFVTHRIAGPIFRIKRGIREIAEGNLSISIHLRKNDEFHDVAEEINAMASRLRQCMLTLKDNNSLLAAYVDDLEKDISEKWLDEKAGRRIIHQIQGSKAAIQDVLDRFNI